MHTVVLSLSLVVILFGKLTNKIVQATKGAITKSAKKELIDNIIKDANLTPGMQNTVRKLLGGIGSRQSGSIILIFILMTLHLLGA
ncbi:uncharacterized protein DEA37_0003512 [Paragonimus westermani]|uniref:Uncharacterized protein n=1 Tax=Paragonimus westermani TaxID=34504 RepID=A0A5J4N845_9TREM|nr:uncharacterized protein DEA37_0003512 [Paragonimus westermani]